MRNFALLLLPMPLMGCASDAPRATFFANSLRVSRAACSPVAALNERGSIVNDVVVTSDSTLVVLYGPDRELVSYGAAFTPISSVAFEREGPRGVRVAVSATWDGDRFYVADEKQLLIKAFDLHGRDRGATRLDFVPRRVRAAGKSIVVSPLVMAGHPTSLLYRLREGKLQSLSVPTVRYDDIGLNAFANMSSLAGFADGRVIIMHEMIVPFGYSLSLSASASSITRFAVPLAERQRPKLGVLPPPPMTENSLASLLAVALAAAPDPRSGHTYYLTRTGRQVEGYWEKMVVELDTALRFVRAAVIPNIRPLHIAFLPARAALLLVDEASQWFECRL